MWPWKYRSKSRCTTLVMTPFDGKWMISYPMEIVMFALSLTICEIFAKMLKCKSVNLENEDQGQRLDERDLRSSTGKCSIPYRWFFGMLATRQHIFTQKGCTHIHSEMTIDKICKADLPKNRMHWHFIVSTN